MPYAADGKEIVLGVAVRGLLGSLRAAWIARLVSRRCDPTRLSAALRRDAGIDDAEAERIEALRRPLIR